METNQFLISILIALFVAVPWGSWLTTIILMALPYAQKPISRQQFQSSAKNSVGFILIVQLALYISLFIGLLADLRIATGAGYLSFFAYSYLCMKVAQRLTGMGYKRFYGLICIAPIIGPAFISYLLITNHERKTESNSN